MSSHVAASPFEKLIGSWKRTDLLKVLNVAPNACRIEDVVGLRPFAKSVKSACCLHKSHAPFLGKIPGNICSGVKLMRDGRTTVGVPCCATEISAESGFCKQCEELFTEQNFDEDGFVELEEEALPDFFERYEPGKSGVLWHAPPVVHAEDLFSGQVQEVKDRFADTSRALSRDWPDATFRDIASPLCFGAGLALRC